MEANLYYGASIISEKSLSSKKKNYGDLTMAIPYKPISRF